MGSSRPALCAQTRAEDREGGRRFVDLCVDFETWEGETFLSCGGRWDRRRKRNAVGDPKTSKVFRLQPAQHEAGQVFLGWLRAKLAKEVYRVGPKQRAMRALLLAGGRRGGKTDVAVRMAIAYALAFPKRRVWIVSPAIPETEEVDLALQEFLPKGWYRRLGAPWYRYKLANGSTITLRSAHDPKDLKRGRCDFAVMNEAQKMNERAYHTVRGALADKGGLVVLAANPPDEAIGQWIADFVEQSEAGVRPGKVIFIDARKNPIVDQDSLDDMKHEMSERDYLREREGQFLGRLDVAFHAWSQTLNVRPIPDIATDVTREFTEKHFGKPYNFISGWDFQLHPYMACVLFKAFRDPEDPTGEPLLWAVDSALIRGSEDELIDALEGPEHDYHPDEVLCVVDASAHWQGSETMAKRGKVDKKPEQIRGRFSTEVMKQRGWRHIVKPDKAAERNPEITERVAAANARFCTADRKRHVFSDPTNLELNEALRKWEIKNGVPYRRSDFAHLCDCVSYVLFRLYPRRKRRGKFRIDNIARQGRNHLEGM